MCAVAGIARSMDHARLDDATPLLLDEPQRPSSIFCCFFSYTSSSSNKNIAADHTSHLRQESTKDGPIIVSKLPINQKSINRHRASFYSRLGVHVLGPPPESRDDKPEELLNDIRSPIHRGGPAVKHLRNKSTGW